MNTQEPDGRIVAYDPTWLHLRVAKHFSRFFPSYPNNPFRVCPVREKERTVIMANHKAVFYRCLCGRTGWLISWQKITCTACGKEYSMPEIASGSWFNSLDASYKISLLRNFALKNKMLVLLTRKKKR